MISLLLCLPACFEPPPRTIPTVCIVTAEQARVFEAVALGTRESEPMDAETTERFQAYRARIGVLSAALEPPPSLDTASLLDRELYEDMGVPYLNGRWQDMVVESIGRVAQRPDAPPEVLDVLRQTLLEYKAAGGGSADPCYQIGLARALAMYGGPENPECDRQAISLCEQATNWSQELGVKHYIEIAATGRAEIELAIAWKEGGVHELGAAPKEVRRALSSLETALRALMLGEQSTPEHVERATTAATHPQLTGRLEQDPLCRLLIAFRMVLDGKKRPAKEVVQAIDEKLLWLPRDARKLTTVRHWSLWADAVTALGGVRASRALEKYVFHETLKSELEPAVVKEIERAREGLRRSNTPRAQRPSTSQPAAPTTQPGG